MHSDGMGSETEDLVSVQEAADRLRVSLKTVHNMVKRGLLTPIYRKNQESGHLVTCFRSIEISAIAESRLEEYSLPKVANQAARALAIAQNAQRQLDSVLELLGVSSFSLPFEEDGIIALFTDAQDKSKTASTLEEKDALFWSKVFTQISEEYFDLIVKFVGEEQPWLVFLALGEKLSKDLLEITSLTVDKVKVLLGASRRHLRNTAYFYVRSREGSWGLKEKMGKHEAIDDEIIRLMFLN